MNGPSTITVIEPLTYLVVEEPGEQSTTLEIIYGGVDARTWMGQPLDPAYFTDPDANEVPIWNDAAGMWQTSPMGSGGGGGPVAWDDILGKPSTFPPSAHTHPPADLTGFGAAGGYLRSSGAAWVRAQGVAWADLTGVPATFPPATHTHPWADITGEPTTLAGYGITDAYTITQVDALLAGKANAAHTHTAADILGGTFGAGAFKFPAGLTVTATVATPLRVEFDANRYADITSDSFGSFNFKTFGPGDTSVNFFARYFGTYDGQVIITGPGPGTGYQLEIYDGDTAWTDFEADPLGLLITPNPAGGNVRIVGAGLSVGGALSVTGHATFLGGTTGVVWGDLGGVPATFPPSAHTHPPTDLTGFGAAGGYLRSDGSAWVRASGVAYTDLTGVPATFPPSAHTHPFTDVTGTLAYAQLPTGGGTWANGGALSITGGAVTVAGLTSTSTVTATTATIVTGAAGTARAVAWQTAGVNRFTLGISSTAESGGNAGSNFFLAALDDAGAGIDQPITLVRAANGALTLSRPFVHGGTLTPASGFAWRTISTVNAAAGVNNALMQVGGVIVEAASGTHAMLSAIQLQPPTITAGAATVTEVATLYLTGAPSASGATAWAIKADSGNAYVGGDIVIPSGFKFRPDGSISGDTYFSEAAANDVRWVAGGNLVFGISGSGPYVPALTFFSLSGGGGNSGIRETSAGSVDLIAAGAIIMRFNAAAGGSAVSFGSLAVLPTAKMFFDGGSDHYAYEPADNILDFYSNANTHQVRIDGATALANGDTCLFVRRRDAGADATNRVQWKAFSTLAAADKVLVIA